MDITSRGGLQRSKVDTDHFIARIGVAPNTELFTSYLTTDQRGYITVDNLCRTNVADVYAIGDVANSVSPTISTAVGTGSIAAKHFAAMMNAKYNKY